MFAITYTYSVKVGGSWRTNADNQVGRAERYPVGYGPNGPAGYFSADEIGRVVKVLTEQLGTIPTITLHPVYDGREW